MVYTPQGGAAQPLRGALDKKTVATPLAVGVHPGIAWLQRCEAKIFLIRTGEEGVDQAIADLAPGFFDKNVVIGRDWLGMMPEPGAAIYFGAEDDENELHIRLAAIAKHYEVTFDELTVGGLHILPLHGKDATLCALNNKTGRIEVTSLYKQLYEMAGDIRPKNISIDTLSRAFAGNEIDRVHVYAFLMHMQALALVANGSVTVLCHPSLAGISSASGLSGSTGWHGGARFRQYLKGVKAEAGQTATCGSLSSRKISMGPAAPRLCCAISAACS